MNQLRKKLLGLAVAVLTTSAIAVGNPLPAAASSVPSNYLQFYCTWQLQGTTDIPTPQPVDRVYVSGYNQNLYWIGHQFPSYYTYDYPYYYWWAEGQWIHYTVEYHDGQWWQPWTIHIHYASGWWYVPNGYNGWTLTVMVPNC